MLAILVLVTLLAPLIAPYDPSATSPNSLEGSSPQHLLGTDANGVNRYAVRGDLRQAFFAQRAAVLRAIAEQHDAGERNAPRTLQHLNERIADACLRARRRNGVERIQRRRGLREAEQPHFERIFELRERPIL